MFDGFGLAVEWELANGTLVLHVVGEIDVASERVLRSHLHRVPASSRVVLDFAEVSFMDSTGIRALLDHQMRLTTDGGSLLLRDASRQVRLALLASGLADRFMQPSS